MCVQLMPVYLHLPTLAMLLTLNCYCAFELHWYDTVVMSWIHLSIVKSTLWLFNTSGNTALALLNAAVSVCTGIG